MAELRDLWAANVTFLSFDSESGLCERFEHLFGFVKMLRERAGPDDDIVDVHEAIFPIHVCENTLHQSLKRCRGIRQAEGHCRVLKKTES